MLPKSLKDWFRSKGWKPFPYQRETWEAYLSGDSGLVHAPTGMGKSYAAWLGPIIEWLKEQSSAKPTAIPLTAGPSPRGGERGVQKLMEPIRVLWITPMRALANDLVVSLSQPIHDLQLPWEVGMRTGDTSLAVRKRQREKLPTGLVTTPESLSLLLSYPEAREQFRTLRTVVVDEWHELLGTKRGVQTELCLARLRSFLPQLRTWGLSATLGNLQQALEVLTGNPQLAAGSPPANRLIHAADRKRIEISTLLPEDIVRFPWSGHLGVRLLPQVIEAIGQFRSTLVFTNTRSQAEIWFRALLQKRPDWAAEIALHHGSLDRDLRGYVEMRLREGTLKCVVCTSSLDLGVDFAPVDQVIQVGSPKGIARLLQRAGRSGHQPGAVSRVLCVPTHAFELVEYAGARAAAQSRALEGREPLEKPLDVLVQHLVTMALPSGFEPAEMLREVRTTYAYRQLTDAEWQWSLDFVTRGGPALKAYPQFSRLVWNGERYFAASPKVARLHRMMIGTIASDTSVTVRFMRGGVLGSIEESFIARLKPKEKFVFAGKTLELVLWKDMTAYVRLARTASGNVPRWDGGRFPLSTELAAAVRSKLDQAMLAADPEMLAVRPILELQAAWSRVPSADELLVEQSQTREGHQCFVYPFEGRSVNEGLACLFAYRFSQRSPRTISITSNDYGFELLSHQPFDLSIVEWREILSQDRLLEDLLACLNTGELTRRQFRDIARIAGLVFSGYPGAARTARQLQASTGLIYDVLREYDPQNMLVEQSRREVLATQLELSRLQRALERISRLELAVVEIPRLTPLAFPLWAARIQKTHLSTEKWSDRVSRMVVKLEQAADASTSFGTRRSRAKQGSEVTA